LVDNFEYFQDRIAEGEVPLDALYRGLTKLLVVDVALDRSHDNPQLIFESLNSTGLDLSQSDLLRNYVLMGLEPTQQERLYEQHWRPIELILARSGRDDTFDRFLRAWLSLRLGEVPNIRRGYEAFKDFRDRNREQPITELLSDLHNCAKCYASIALGQETNPRLARVFAGLSALRIDAPMPFLIHAYLLWKAGTVSDADMIGIAELMESWLFRRAVCDIPSNVLSRTFATLPGQFDDSKLLEEVSVYLASRTGRQRFPRDEEFRAALASRNLYDFKHRQYCLTRLENEDRKEPVDIGEYTVEHVMPQNESLSAEWQAMLGPAWSQVQERWIHTLGNLTLTGYNPELSDRPFVVKRDMEGGFADSPLRLNRSLGKAQLWNEKAIEQRTAELTTKALRIWPGPKVSEAALASRTKGPEPNVRRSRENLDHIRMSPLTRKLVNETIEGAAGLDLEPTIWKHWIGIGKPGAGKPYPLIVHPRKDWLRVQLRVPFEELTDPPACTYAHETKRGASRTRGTVRTSEEVAACVAVLSSIPSLSRIEASDEDDGDAVDDPEA
jgi:hypothetical protein